MLKCKDVVQQVTDRSEQAPPLGTRVSLWFHTMMCSHCRRFLRQFEHMRGMLTAREFRGDDKPTAGRADVADAVWQKHQETMPRTDAQRHR
jgi:hypothetical protein